MAPCRCLDGHVKEPYEMSMALGARPKVQLLLQSACTSLCRHIYNWNIVACDVKQPISLTQFRSAVSEEKSKMLQSIRGKGGHLFLPIGPKNKNLVEDVESLLPDKFHWILFSGFRGEVENVSANQRPGRPSCFSDRPEKHNLGRGG